jgi:uncharacterized protein YdiU (UPF0061 family)
LRGQPEALQALFGSEVDGLAGWLTRWQARLGAVPAAEVAQRMDAVNPIYIPRNHLVEHALEAATESDNLAPFEALLGVITRPYDERANDALFAQPASAEQSAGYRTFCGT